jgi:hypothetical protein
MTPFEGMTVGLGHAATVSRTAGRISEVDIQTGGTWLAATEDTPTSEPSARDPFDRLL